MPRVNRDLQRRMAARRDRERRRPTTERQYRFVTPEPELEAEEAAPENGSAAEAAEPTTARKSRQARASAGAAASPSASQPRAGRLTRPFSAYRDEYAYVYGDLRRIGVVVGSLLVVLIVLYFVLPLLAR